VSGRGLTVWSLRYSKTTILYVLVLTDVASVALASEAIAGAAFTLIYKRLRSSGSGSLMARAPMLAYIALCPFLGAVCGSVRRRSRKVRWSA